MTIIFNGYGLICLGIACALLIYHSVFRTSSIRRNGIPLRKPPDTLPIAGNGLLFLQEREKLFSWFVKCERQFGYETFQITVPSLHAGVVINDPKNIDYIFKHEGIFLKGDFVKQRSWDLFGNGIINADGELWRAQRKAGSHFLSASNLRVLTDVALPHYLSRSVSHLRTQVKAGAIIDLQLVFHEITSLLMGKLAYDMEMHADDEFTTAFDHASGAVTERFQNPLWFVTELFTGSRFRKSLAIVHQFGLGIVNNAVDGHRKPKESRAQPNDVDGNRLDQMSGSLIQSLLASLGSSKPQLVADAALTFLTAGRDTTAQALTWCLYLLMKNQDAIETIRKEAQGVLAAQSSSPRELGSQGNSTSAVFAPISLPYTMAVFYEALRLFPPIPFEIRECEQATTLPDGTFLPQKAVVLWSIWAMNRSKITWGEDADSFRPERWLTDKGKLITKSPSEFSVFYGGLRICLGKRMAEIIATQVLATMVLLFDFTPAFEGDRVSKISLTLPMKNGLPCYVKDRA
ncbi:cytochrome P450 [Astrocystis sublimbata]|nr:cytochrome P450 [Astrocystis sublimbata]